MFWHTSRDTFPAFAVLLKPSNFARCVNKLYGFLACQDLKRMVLVFAPELRLMLTAKLAHGGAIPVRSINRAKDELA
jgi:hypothetical protein